MDFRFAFKVIRMAILGFWIIIFASAGLAIVCPVRAAVPRCEPMIGGETIACAPRPGTSNRSPETSSRSPVTCRRAGE